MLYPTEVTTSGEARLFINIYKNFFRNKFCTFRVINKLYIREIIKRNFICLGHPIRIRSYIKKTYKLEVTNFGRTPTHLLIPLINSKISLLYRCQILLIYSYWFKYYQIISKERFVHNQIDLESY